MVKKHLSLILAVFMITQALCLTASADAIKLADDLDALTRESLLKVNMGTQDLLVDKLNLPKQGTNGSTILWTSAPDGVIAENGMFTIMVKIKD